jgi:hypothetical protein
MGANPLTFMGLAGIGDLFLTCTSVSACIVSIRPEWYAGEKPQLHCRIPLGQGREAGWCGYSLVLCICSLVVSLPRSISLSSFLLMLLQIFFRPSAAQPKVSPPPTLRTCSVENSGCGFGSLALTDAMFLPAGRDAHYRRNLCHPVSGEAHPASRPGASVTPSSA